MTAPAYQSVAHTESATTTLNAAAPAGTVAGDYCLAFVAFDINTNTVTGVGAGYTLLAGPQDGGNADERIYVYEGVNTGTTTWTTNVARSWSVVIVRVSGQNGTPVDDFGTGTGSAANAALQPLPAGVVSTVADTLAVSFIASDQSAVTPPTLTPPSTHGGWTERLDTENVGANMALGVATVTIPVSGTTVTGDWNITASDRAAVATVLLKPTAGAALGRSQSESAPAGDATARAIAPSRAISETGAGTDTVARSSARARAVGETAAATDSTSGAVTHSFARSQSETAAATDTSARAQTAARAVSEAAPAIDTVSRSSARSRSTSESAPATDATSSALGKARSISETAAASDSTATSSTRARSITETAPATDSVSRATSRPRALTESAAATDSLTRSQTLTRALSDSAPAVDATAASSGGNASRTTSESAPAADTTTRTTARSRTTAETAAAADTTTRQSARTRSTSEAAPASDLAQRATARARAQLDIALATDSTTGVVTAAPEFVELDVQIGLRRRNVDTGLDSLNSAGVSLERAGAATMRRRGIYAAIRPREVDA